MILDPQQLIKKQLRTDFIDLCSRNGQYSLRSFAMKLNTSNSALSEIMNGKRNISESKYQQFASALNWKDELKTSINNAFKGREAFQKLYKYQDNYLEESLTKSGETQIFSRWEYMSILAALNIDKSERTEKWLSSYFNISIDAISSYVQDLIKMGYIKKEENGLLSESMNSLRTSEDFPKKILNQRLKQGLEGAQKSIDTDDPHYCGMFSNIVVELSRLNEAELMIESFLKSLSMFLSQGEKKDQVMELNIHLFSRGN